MKCLICSKNYTKKHKTQTMCSRKCAALNASKYGSNKTRGIKKESMPVEIRKKISASKSGTSIWGGKRGTLEWMVGENNHKWMGDRVGYDALHDWISRYGIKLGYCQYCGTSKKTKDGRTYTQWANISRQYKRDLNDYIELCPSCHLYLDKNNLEISVHKN